MLDIAKRSSSHMAHLIQRLSGRHVFGDVDIIGKEEQKNKRSTTSRNNATTLTALFETESDDSDGPSTTKYGSWYNKHKRSWTDTKSDTGFVGLDNLACICYMNSSLQNLYMVPEFRAAVLSIPLDITNPNGLYSGGRGGGKGKNEEEGHYSNSVFYQLQRLMSYLSGSEKRSYNPKPFCSVFPDLGNSENNVDVATDVFTQVRHCGCCWSLVMVVH